MSFSADTIHAAVSTFPGHCDQALLERSSLTRMNEKSFRLSREHPRRCLIWLIHRDLRSMLQCSAHRHACVIRQCRSYCTKLETPIIHVLRSTSVFPTVSRADPSSVAAGHHQTPTRLSLRHPVIPHQRSTFVPLKHSKPEARSTAANAAWESSDSATAWRWSGTCSFAVQTQIAKQQSNKGAPLNHA